MVSIWGPWHSAAKNILAPVFGVHRYSFQFDIKLDGNAGSLARPMFGGGG